MYDGIERAVALPVAPGRSRTTPRWLSRLLAADVSSPLRDLLTLDWACSPQLSSTLRYSSHAPGKPLRAFYTALYFTAPIHKTKLPLFMTVIQ